MVLPCCSWADGRLREHALSASGETRRTAQRTRCCALDNGPGRYPWDLSEESTCNAEPAAEQKAKALYD